MKTTTIIGQLTPQLNTIVSKIWLNQEVVLMDIYNPYIAKSCLPGHFVILKLSDKGERIPLTIADYDIQKGSITIIVHVIGKTTKIISNYKKGEQFSDLVGPLGQPSEYVQLEESALKNKNILFVAGGVGVAPIFPQVKWWALNGIKQDVIVGARTKDLVLLESSLHSISKNLFIATDDGSLGAKGFVTDIIKQRVENDKIVYDSIIAIGPMIMMKVVSELTRKYNIKTIVSLNSLMVDGTGMCGACRVSIGDKTKFTCVDGPEFDGHLVNFDEAMRRQNMFKSKNIKIGDVISELEKGDEDKHLCNIHFAADVKKSSKQRVKPKERLPEERVKSFEEVCLGYTIEEAVKEAERCIQCKNPLCVAQCPVNIKIPQFIKSIKENNIAQAAQIIYDDSCLPSICGRVCPQETQCEGACILGKKSEPIAIGLLERFVGDWVRENKKSYLKANSYSNNHKVAIIGGGPAGITCAGELAQKGYIVSLFEALHEPGGVLIYGIPDFRLPKDIVRHEINQIKEMGVDVRTNIVIGKTFTIEKLFQEENYKAVFIASGAGLPKFMNIKGENLNGVFSANEFLTRNILMSAYNKEYDTPVYVGNKAAVIGGGNVAMDAARTARRLGADVSIIYRRTENELPARKEEVKHAKEEGIHFNMLTSPIEIIGNESGWVESIKCIKMDLGNPDATGRRSPVEIKNSEFIINADTVIMSIGTSPNPLIAKTTSGLVLNNSKGIKTNNSSGQTSIEGVFAGGDAVNGAATVILAMGAGKEAAQAIDKYIKTKY